MKRNFVLLAGLTAAAFLAVSLLAPEHDNTGNIADRPLLLPDMASRINAVDRVDVITAGNVTVATMVKAGQLWQLQQMNNYHSDWPKLKTLLAALATAKVIEAKTDKAEYYSRLGVADTAAKDAASVLVRLSVGDQQTGVIIGHRAKGGEGQYVRVQGQAASALVDQKLDAPTETLQWADKKIIDINSSEVSEVEIIHPGGHRILATKASADDTDFKLSEIPKGREIKGSWAVNSLGSALSLLDLVSVRADSDIDWSAAPRMRLLTFSGMEIMVDMLESDGQYLIKLHASKPGAELTTNLTAATKTGIDKQSEVLQLADNEKEGSKKEGNKTDTKKPEDKAVTDVKRRVEEINQRVTGWAYGISKSKFEALVKQPEDLLKPLESS